MVARLIEGWESSTVLADYAGKWTGVNANAIAPANGRAGNGLRCTQLTSGVSRVFDAQATWVLGFALRVNAASSDTICYFLDGGTLHCGVALNASLVPFAWRGAVGTVLGTGSSGLTANTWAYVEVKVTINDTTGSVHVRVNGAPVLALTNVDTRNAGNPTANAVRLGSTGNLSTSVFEYDDIYIFDGTGSVNNDFAGDCRVAAVRPTGAGATAAWTPSAGANYACVDEAPPNADTDYVSSATAGQTDTYAFADLAVIGTVKAVQATAVVRKDDAGTRTLALVARPGGTDRPGATQAVGDSYGSLSEIWNTNPDTAGAWTVAELNAGEWGVKLVS
jgi:hypothetical protein